MVNLIAGLLGVTLLVLFLGLYAVQLDSVPLWIIIVAILVMVVVDFVLSLRKDPGNDASGS